MFAMCLFSESWEEISLSVPRRYTDGSARVINCMSLEFAGEAQSKDTVVGVGGVLFPYETGKTHAGGGDREGRAPRTKPWKHCSG